MSLRIIAIRHRKILLRWLEENCSDYTAYEEVQGDEYFARFTEARKVWNVSNVYEVKVHNVEQSIETIIECLSILGYSRAHAILGEYEALLVVDASLDDIARIIQKMIPNKTILSIVANDCSGYVGVDYSLLDESYELMIAGAGNSIVMPSLVEQRIPGGDTYPADWV